MNAASVAGSVNPSWLSPIAECRKLLLQNRQVRRVRPTVGSVGLAARWLQGREAVPQSLRVVVHGVGVFGGQVGVDQYKPPSSVRLIRRRASGQLLTLLFVVYSWSTRHPRAGVLGHLVVAPWRGCTSWSLSCGRRQAQSWAARNRPCSARPTPKPARCSKLACN